MSHQGEKTRLQFVAERDGVDGAVRFANQAMRAYRAALAQRNKNGKRTGYGLVYRKELVVSCVVFRRFLRDNTYIN